MNPLSYRGTVVVPGQKDTLLCLSSRPPFTASLPHQCFLASPSTKKKKNHSRQNPCLGIQLWGSQLKEERRAPFIERLLTTPSPRRAPPILCLFPLPGSHHKPLVAPVSSWRCVPTGQSLTSRDPGAQIQESGLFIDRPWAVLFPALSVLGAGQHPQGSPHPPRPSSRAHLSPALLLPAPT